MTPFHMIPLLRAVLSDAKGGENPVAETATHLQRVMKWLAQAQDATCDDGVSEGFHLVHGWLPSYPETTGYIIETFMDYGRFVHDRRWIDRAMRMAHWLRSIQDRDGAMRDASLREKLVFDTGQALFGLVRAYGQSGSSQLLDAAVQAGSWLCNVQEPNGSWVRFAFAGIPHSYYVRVAWSLLALNAILPDDRWVDHATSNCDWVLSQQHSNGWFSSSGFREQTHTNPYTHTLAYTLRGLLECGLALREPRYVTSVRHAIDRVLESIPQDGRVAGSYDHTWTGDRSFSCLTGDAQLAIVMMRLHTEFGDEPYWRAAKLINRYLMGKQASHHVSRHIDGAMAGSDPCWGKYIRFCFPNWAAKFFAESLMLELDIAQRHSGAE